MRLACIGIGSNAIRLLVAQWQEGQLQVVSRERRGTRLFAGLIGGELTQESMSASIAAVAELAAIARAQNAQRVFVFATSAVRDARNGADFTARCEEACGACVEIVTGEEEAALSYYGASEGGMCGVIDIGGGSTEFTLGEDERIFTAMSLQMGAVRMHAQLPVVDWKSYLDTVDRCIKLIRRDAGAIADATSGACWIGVGGTMTTLGAMERSVPLFDPDLCEGIVMPFEQVAAWGKRLACMPMAERRQVVGLMPHRADIIPSGIAILEAAMRCLGITQIRLSAHGNMDGYLKKKFRAMG